jgi:hypothetical protein
MEGRWNLKNLKAKVGADERGYRTRGTNNLSAKLDQIASGEIGLALPFNHRRGYFWR